MPKRIGRRDKVAVRQGEMTETSGSDWQTDELPRFFLEGVRGAIPGVALQFAVIGKIVDRWSRSPRRILDLGCGNGILGQFLLARFPSARGLFLDFSDAMLAAAREQVGSFGRAVVVRADFGSPRWLEAAAPHAPFDLVVSGFAIHHQPDERKRELYSEIFGLLEPGGIFLNLEHVASATEAGEELFDEFFVDHLHEYHVRADPRVDRDAVADKYYRRSDKKENILAGVVDQCAWLREIGFADVDCFFKLFELAIFGGRKGPPCAR